MHMCGVGVVGGSMYRQRMTNRIRSSVGQSYVDAWREAAIRVRYIDALLPLLGDPAPGSQIEADDKDGHGEYLSDDVRSSLWAAADNLHLWANVISPLQVVEGEVVENPPRPYFTLARAGLEAAAQAAWVLGPDERDERADRHLRLVVNDLKEMHTAARHTDTALEASVKARIESIRAAHTREIKTAPSYVAMVREGAPRVGFSADDGELLWRTASAAAHGKRWFTGATHHTIVGDEFAPGRRRAEHVPDPHKVTLAITLATTMTEWATNRYGELAGAPVADLGTTAIAQVAANMPRRVRVVAADG